MIVSITRLHTRWQYLLPFLTHVRRVMRQVQRSDGFLDGTLALEPPLAFWTFTVWTDEQAMRAFRNTGDHMKAMPRLLGWCDEASYVRWEQDDPSPPTPATAFERLRDDGKLSKVKRPSSVHAAGRTTGRAKPRLPLALRSRPR